jgi:hypothetical protein
VIARLEELSDVSPRTHTRFLFIIGIFRGLLARARSGFLCFCAKSARQLSWWASRAPFFRCVGWIALTRGSARAPPPRSSLRTSHDVPKQARERGADAANGVAAAGASRVAREARSSTDEMCLARGFLKTESLEPSTRGDREGRRAAAREKSRAGSPPAPRARRAAHPPEALVAGAGLLVAPHAPRASRGCSLAVVVSARKPSLPRSRRVARGSACGARPKHENDFCFLTKNRLDDHLASADVSSPQKQNQKRPQNLRVNSARRRRRSASCRAPWMRCTWRTATYALSSMPPRPGKS